MNREQLKALEKETLEKLARIRASMAFLDRRDVRQKLFAGLALVGITLGLAYQMFGG